MEVIKNILSDYFFLVLHTYISCSQMIKTDHNVTTQVSWQGERVRAILSTIAEWYSYNSEKFHSENKPFLAERSMHLARVS